MSILELFLISLILCAIYYIIVVTFPEDYKKGGSKRKINALLLISSLVYIVIAIVLYALYRKFGTIIDVDFKEALLFIPLISIVLFSVNIYYPAVRILARHREQELIFADELLSVIFDYKYMPTDQREKAIERFKTIFETKSKQLKQYGIEVYIKKLIEQSQGATSKAPAALIDYCEEKCMTLYKSIEEYSLMPFSNISMISSFCLSYILTILLTYVTII